MKSFPDLQNPLLHLLISLKRYADLNQINILNVCFFEQRKQLFIKQVSSVERVQVWLQNKRIRAVQL